MPKAGTVQYIVDDRGRKKSVIMSYKAYQQLLEDITDLTYIEDRKNDPRRDLESILSELKNDGRL